MTDSELSELQERLVVRVNPARVPRHVRVCTMSNLSTEAVSLALTKWLLVIEEFRYSLPTNDVDRKTVEPS